MTNSTAAALLGRPGLSNDSSSLDSLPVGRVLPRVPGIAFGWQSNRLVYRKGWCSGNLAGVLADCKGFTVSYVFNRLEEIHGGFPRSSR